MKANEIRIEWKGKVIYPALESREGSVRNSIAVVTMESHFLVL